jgi:hypothetical protein
MKFLLLFLCIHIAASAYSQGNLQFNQVLRVSITGVNLASNGQHSIMVTVPAGKVWKVESSDVHTYNTATPNLIVPTNSFSVILGGSLLNIIYKSAQGFLDPLLPKWYPAGSYDLTIKENNGVSQNGATVVGVVSIIEFNVVP